MRTALAVVMLVHGIAHLPGFLTAWRIAELADLPYQTSLLFGRMDVGDVGIRAIGMLWLLAALGFWFAAVGALLGRDWWPAAALVTIVASLPLTLLQLPATAIGVAANVAIAAAVLAAPRLGLAGATS